MSLLDGKVNIVVMPDPEKAKRLWLRIEGIRDDDYREQPDPRQVFFDAFASVGIKKEYVGLGAHDKQAGTIALGASMEDADQVAAMVMFLKDNKVQLSEPVQAIIAGARELILGNKVAK